MGDGIGGFEKHLCNVVFVVIRDSGRTDSLLRDLMRNKEKKEREEKRMKEESKMKQPWDKKKLEVSG